jgi:hypothetical protein
MSHLDAESNVPTHSIVAVAHNRTAISRPTVAQNLPVPIISIFETSDGWQTTARWGILECEEGRRTPREGEGCRGGDPFNSAALGHNILSNYR